MRLPSSPRPPKLHLYIPKKPLLHLSRFMENLETVISWSQKYPHKRIPKTYSNHIFKSFPKLKPKLETLSESARLYNQCHPKISSRPTSSSNTKRCACIKTADRNSERTRCLDDGDTRGSLGEPSKDSETSAKFSRCFLLHRRIYGHVIKEDFDETVHFIEVQEGAEDLKEDNLTTKIACSPKEGIACRSKKGSKSSLAPTKFAESVKCISMWLTSSIRNYNVFHGRGLISTIPICGKVQRLELEHCRLKDSGPAEEHVLQPLDLMISYLQDLSRQELSNTAQAKAKESLFPTCHAVLLFEAPTLQSEDAEIMDESDRFQDLTIHEEVVGYKPSTIQSLGRADTVCLIYLAMSSKSLRQSKTSSFAIGLALAKDFIDREMLVRGKCSCGAKYWLQRSIVPCETCQAFRDTAEGSSFRP